MTSLASGTHGIMTSSCTSLFVFPVPPTELTHILQGLWAQRMPCLLLSLLATELLPSHTEEVAGAWGILSSLSMSEYTLV